MTSIMQGKNLVRAFGKKMNDEYDADKNII